MSEPAPDRQLVLAWMASNLLSGDSRAFNVMYSYGDLASKPSVSVNAAIVEAAVATARAVMAEVERTEPSK